MKRTYRSRPVFAALFTAIVLTSVAAVAKDGRDFAGYYSLTNMSDKGAQVELTLGLHLFNNTATDLQQAVVTVRGVPAGLGVLGTFPPVKLWRAGSDIAVSRQLTISQHEYRHWAGRMQPNVFVNYRDQNGQPRQGWAQLSRRPAIPQNLPTGQ
jgi:hypothetical protein